ncbi:MULTISPECIES: aldehyde dehydrogenase family protein [Pseudomonas]|jgi:aldehyde dehydrogenase (NAD+)|uniref:aldehyde dehydrogenase family protein n=1 Tax=Pseudomonas TaxID=286 RepID=UPI0006D3BAA6|nr:MULTISPECIES: aldehyde dehydrogenase family protein [Pseudomonas]EKT4539027.1 aldehyde dehydrogenase family protein [Pseudomonas putida]MCF1250994.1 aldehyde dehydrogenase family protein [Pseudomonas putida]MDH1693097.1 aldehyde dehydrogenase family protein [Pseudomonas sp. GD03766]MDN5518214.1 aldehyde dehydrogenase family protein [Pseudomonas sp.]MDN5530384.1 aldehyde dehydrogenase family protein [Pseudomonas sp.]
MSHKTYNNYIDGQWCEGHATLGNYSPSDTGDLIGQYHQASAEQARQAIQAARAAQPLWAASGLESRQQVLMAIGDELIARKEELGELLSREEGKPLAEGIGEVNRSGQFFHYYAAEVLRQMGETAASVRPGVDIEVHREPVGVVGIITPWNFPMATAAWKIAPALAFGNAVVFKPANLVPASAWALTEIISRQGLPNGTFNLVMGSGADVGEALIESAEIDALTFTGSLQTGRRVAVATAGNLVRCQLEMGSKNALVVMDDADLELAVECALNGAFFGTGQKCTASSRLIVCDGIHDRFVEALRLRMRQLKVGHALEAGVQIGPVADARQLEQNLAYLQLAQAEGATLIEGGERLQLASDGYYMRPALFINSRNDMRINREEVFGPIACVIRVRDFEEALATLNDTEYGLTAGIITQSLRHASHFKRRAQTGCVMVNLPTAGTDYHVPFGGRKASSFGPREQGQYARDFYTVVKTTYLRP